MLCCTTISGLFGSLRRPWLAPRCKNWPVRLLASHLTLAPAMQKAHPEPAFRKRRYRAFFSCRHGRSASLVSSARPLRLLRCRTRPRAAPAVAGRKKHRPPPSPPVYEPPSSLSSASRRHPIRSGPRPPHHRRPSPSRSSRRTTAVPAASRPGSDFLSRNSFVPFTYLGIPIDLKRLSNKQWKPVEEKSEKKLAGWKGNLLSIGGRVILINASMSSVPFYMLSFLKVPKGVLKRWDYHRARMMWQETAGKKKYHPVNWPTVCLPKDSGGLGILDLADMNRSLFANGSGNWKILVEHGKRY